MNEEHFPESAVGAHFEEEVEIAALAHRYYEEEGCPTGRSLEHWVRAEREIRARTAAPSAPSPEDTQPGGPLEDAMHLRQ